MPGIAAQRAEPVAVGTGSFSTLFEVSRSSSPVARAPRGLQVSPNKNACCLRPVISPSDTPPAMLSEPWASPSGPGSPEKLDLLWRSCSLARGSCRRPPPDPSSRRRPRLELVVADGTSAIGRSTAGPHLISSRAFQAYTRACSCLPTAPARSPLRSPAATDALPYTPSTSLTWARRSDRATERKRSFLLIRDRLQYF